MKTAWLGSLCFHLTLAGGLLWVAMDRPISEPGPARAVTVALVEAPAESPTTVTAAVPVPTSRPARAEPNHVMPNRPESNPIQSVSAEPVTDTASVEPDGAPPVPASAPATSTSETDTVADAMAASPAGGAVDALSDPWPAYYAAVRDAVERVKRYPFSARLSGLEDRVAVNFFIAADGAAREIRLTEPSRFPILNDAALDTIRRVARFPSPPLRESQSGVRVTVPLEFTLHTHQEAPRE
jgi:protein TonB